MSNIQETLNERGRSYGEFQENARISQDLKATMHGTQHWDAMMPHQQEALEMITMKISRILNGDSDFADSWQDIAGYAQLVHNILTTGTSHTGGVALAGDTRYEEPPTCSHGFQESNDCPDCCH